MLERAWRSAAAVIAAASLTGGLLAGSAVDAFANYGSGAAYQIEISDNCNGQQSCYIAQGDGVWLWIELTPSSPGATSGTGDYNGADCVHNLVTPGGTFSGAASDHGEVTWSLSSDGTTLVITGVSLIGGEVPVTITVPSSYGHHMVPGSSVIPGFGNGMAQVQVAP